MQAEFLDKFNRDLDKIKVKAIKSAVEQTILRIENARAVNEIPNLKKLSGFKSAYRIRIGDYRIGVFIVGSLVQFARIVHRKDIYKVFP